MSKKNKKLKKKTKKSIEKDEKKYAKQRAKRGFSDRDAWDIPVWFLTVMPKMLEELRKNHQSTPLSVFTEEELDLIEQPTTEENKDAQDRIDKAGRKRWNDILDHMIFLLNEMNEDKCSMKNPYDAEVKKADEEFTRKYGSFGGGYKTVEEKAAEKAGQYTLLKTSADIPENKKLYDQYFAYEKKILKYREECTNEFFKVFTKHFEDLWD